MSELKRLERIVRSLIPRIPRDPDRQYSLADARNMINELGLQMPPEVMAYLLERDAILDDFISSIYDLEARLNRKVVQPQGTLDEQLQPRVRVEEGKVAFTIEHRGQEKVFAEYDLTEG